MSSRNSQYIITDNQKQSKNDIRKEVSFWKLQLLNNQTVQGINNSLDNINENKEFVPTDLAIKEYVKATISKFRGSKKTFGERENYYGVYNGQQLNGKNSFVRTIGGLNPMVVSDDNSPLIVKLENKEYTFINCSADAIASSTLKAKMNVTLADSRLGTDESKYMYSVGYSSINTGTTNKNYYVLVNGSELSTVFVDRTNKKLIFKHVGSTRRGQWRNTNSVISAPEMITSGIHDLLEIRYLFINTNGHVSNTEQEPLVIKASTELNGKPNGTYGYNIYDENWYMSNGSAVNKVNVQMIGAVAVDNEGIKAAFSVPNYLMKSQKNTIRLRKNGQKIVSVHGSNVVYMESDVVEKRNVLIEWDFEGLTYKNTTCYLYIDYNGEPQISNVRPFRNPFGGWYLNTSGWRCVGSVFVSNTYELSDPWDFNGTIGGSEQYTARTFAQMPLGFTGTVRVAVSGRTTDYNATALENGMMVDAGTKIEYLENING